MASQSIMVPPNTTPWPGLQTPSSSSSTPSSSSAPGAASAYPYHPSYYHHPHHPPPPPHHPTSHHQSYYPYHPYPGSYPPHYPPAPSGHSPSHGSHGHPHPSHPFTPSSTSSDSPPTATSRHRLQAPAQTHHTRSSSPSTRSISSSPTNTDTQSGLNAKSRADKTKQPVLKTKSGRPGTSDTPASTSASNGSTAPKVFRFEGSISSETYKTTKSFDLAGVNILNRKPLDTKTALDKLQRRRETHNRVERKRRDCINQLIDDLTKLLPAKHLEEATSKCHRVNVLRGAVAHITYLTDVNGTLVKALKEVKGDDFDVGILEAGSTAANAGTSSEKKETDPGSRDMSMDVDADVDMEESEPTKEEEEDEEDEIEQDDDDEMDEKPSRDQEKKKQVASAPVAPSSSSPSPSPRLTPSRAMDLPPVIITDAPSPSSDRGSSQTQSKMVPPPISIIPSESSNTPQSAAASPASSYSKSPMFPPSPASSYQSQRSSSTSPALPPISSLANLHLQSPPARSETSPSSERRHHQEEHRYQSYHHQHHGEHLSPSTRPTQTDSVTAKANGHRSGPTLPPLKIPAPHHLHPSYSSERHSGQPSSSPRYHERSSETEGEQQPPVSPFMLSPMLSRSPSMGPLSASSAGNSPYPHWGHEETSPGLPPTHHGHYMPAGAPPPHSSHAYPGYPPYPYPYHPSYGYPPHPHAPPPPPHHHHGHHTSHADASAPRHATSTAAPQPSRSLQPEPIFIQEEPWVVQRKRSTSNISSKNPPPSPSPAAAAVSSSASKTTSSSKKSDEESMEDTAREGSAPLSPSSSITSSVSSSFPGASPNSRKRSSPHKTSHEEGEETVSSMAVSEAKRVKQQELLGADLEGHQQSKKGQQRDSGIVVVVVEADCEVPSSKTKDQEMATLPEAAT